MKIGPKMWPLECSQWFSMIWPYWPSFWHNLDPLSNFTKILWGWSFWASLMMIGPKLWTLECPQGFSMIWPNHLVSDLIWPIFKLNWDIVKMIMLSISDNNWTKNLAFRVFTKIFYDLTYWPSFWHNHDPLSNFTKILWGWFILSKFDDDFT